jgi:hypothetical protein
MDLRDPVADHRQVEGLGHAGDLSPWGDAAAAHLIDHHNVDRTRLDHVAERDNAPEVFAAGDRGRQGCGDACQTGVIIVRRHILEPEQPNTRIFDPPSDVDRLLDPPALVDVAHQIHLWTNRLADQPRLLDFASG